MDAPKSILVIHLAGIGDLLMGRWALECLRRGFPESQIVLLTWTKNLEAAGLIAGIDACIGLSADSSFRALAYNLRVAARLRAQHFDLALNAYQVYRSLGVLKLAVLLVLVAPRKTAGRDTDGKGWCFSQRIKESASDPIHEVRRQLRFVEQLGCPEAAATPKLRLSSEDQHLADQWLGRNGLTPEVLFAVIQPGGARMAHRWPADSFARLATALEDNDGLRIIISGSHAERCLAERIARSLKKPVVAAGELSFGQLAHVLRRCRVFVSNDSGPAHLAAALEIPLVVIFGPGDPNRYGPYPLERVNQVILHAQGELPCFRRRCPTHACLRKLSVERVLQAAREILGERHPAGIERVDTA